jgi:hypothetical protein
MSGLWVPNWFLLILYVLGSTMLVTGCAASILLMLMVLFSDYIRPFALETFRNMGLWLRGRYSLRKAWRGIAQPNSEDLD